jgi:hypothetical protein
MDRGNSKHGRQLDEVMKREVRGHLRGWPSGGRVEEWREPEPSGQGEPDVSAVPRLDRRPVSDARLFMTDKDREGRSRLGTYIPRSAFPADRDELLQAARAARAPDGIIDELKRLPADRRFETVARVWSALGHGFDQRF